MRCPGLEIQSLSTVEESRAHLTENIWSIWSRISCSPETFTRARLSLLTQGFLWLQQGQSHRPSWFSTFSEASTVRPDISTVNQWQITTLSLTLYWTDMIDINLSWILIYVRRSLSTHWEYISVEKYFTLYYSWTLTHGLVILVYYITTYTFLIENITPLGSIFRCLWSDCISL